MALVVGPRFFRDPESCPLVAEDAGRYITIVINREGQAADAGNVPPFIHHLSVDGFSAGKPHEIRYRWNDGNKALSSRRRRCCARVNDDSSSQGAARRAPASD